MKEAHDDRSVGEDGVREGRWYSVGGGSVREDGKGVCGGGGGGRVVR